MGRKVKTFNLDVNKSQSSEKMLRGQSFNLASKACRTIKKQPTKREGSVDVTNKI